jgi:hypothetical protein
MAAILSNRKRQNSAPHWHVSTLGWSDPRVFIDRQRKRPLVEELGRRVLALSIVERRHVVEARGHVGVLGTKRPFLNCRARLPLSTLR